jgi:hypothetical protein
MIQRANQCLRSDSRNFKMWQYYREVISLKEEYRYSKHELRLKSSNSESGRPYRAKAGVTFPIFKSKFLLHSYEVK